MRRRERERRLLAAADGRGVGKREAARVVLVDEHQLRLGAVRLLVVVLLLLGLGRVLKPLRAVIVIAPFEVTFDAPRAPRRATIPV